MTGTAYMCQGHQRLMRDTTDVQGNHSLFGDTKEVSETQDLCKGTTGVSGALQKYQGL